MCAGVVLLMTVVAYLILAVEQNQLRHQWLQILSALLVGDAVTRGMLDALTLF